jgi:hypothetical protein
MVAVRNVRHCRRRRTSLSDGVERKEGSVMVAREFPSVQLSLSHLTAAYSNMGGTGHAAETTGSHILLRKEC